jgi:hypothetical protein
MTNDPNPTAEASADPRDQAAEYSEALTAAGQKLDGALADLRAAQDAGEITVVEAADQRVLILEIHLADLTRLREQYGS